MSETEIEEEIKAARAERREIFDSSIGYERNIFGTVDTEWKSGIYCQLDYPGKFEIVPRLQNFG